VGPTGEQQEIQRAQAGDSHAFAALVDRHWGRVFRWLVSLTRHDQLAEDLTQEAFLRAWRALPTFQPGASFRTWLFGMARNSLIDSKRGPRGTPTRPLADTLASNEPGPVEVALEREGRSLLHDACGRLPEHFRSAFLLWAQEELSFAEVAAALGITEATARWRVFKARLLLVAQLESYLDGKKP
jgi:RNA polymerase sigma-70 factor (ECF subfamily)